MALIPAYQFKPRGVEIQPFAILSKKVIEESGFHQTLDFIALEVEAGRVDTEKFSTQLFDSKAAFNVFCEELASYDECFRITDQWYEALMHIAGARDEEGFLTCEEIVEALRLAAAGEPR
jgi:hypothetical protein